MSTIITITRRLEFDAGHRLMDHEGACKFLHGHRYKVDFHIISLEGLDQLGRVLDFGIIKEKVGAWILYYLDHQLILNMNDLSLIKSVKEYCKGGAPFLMNGNPTAENIAHLLFNKAEELLKDSDIRVVGVDVYETPNCSATIEEK